MLDYGRTLKKLNFQLGPFLLVLNLGALLVEAVA